MSLIPNVQTSYSIVGFATDAVLAADVASTAQTLVALDALAYAGGRTNHAAAIETCSASLTTSPTSADRQNLILLITDGYPSEPQGADGKGSPRAEAERAAEEAKGRGVFIIPVMIVPEYDGSVYVPEPIRYLSGISSDGTVFDATDFSVLDTLRESLLAQVSCQV